MTELVMKNEGVNELTSNNANTYSKIFDDKSLIETSALKSKTMKTKEKIQKRALDDFNFNCCMDQINGVINQFIQRTKIKCQLILEPVNEEHPLIKKRFPLTKEHQNWLLDPRTLNCFKENDWTMEERCEAFRNRFPESPRFAMSTMRHFYDKFGIPKSLLFKQSNLKVS